MGGDYSRFTFDPHKNYGGVLQQQGRVSLDADWNELLEIHDRRWRAETLDILGPSVVPDTTPNAFCLTPTGPGTFTIGIGRIYVDGLLAENHGGDPQRFENALQELRGTTPTPYENQPYYPSPLPPILTRRELPDIRGRTDLVYLDVWQREVTALEDPDIQEIALGGPDTTTRRQTVWQVRVLENVGPHSCDEPLAAWDDQIAPSAGRLSTSAQPPGGDEPPCIIGPAGGYRGLENRLYRVEIHVPGPVGVAKFKWSHDNASVAAAVPVAVDAISSGRDQVTVSQMGRDQVLRFQVGDWIEILDDHLEFQQRAGHLAQITKIDEANRKLTFSPAILPEFEFDPADARRHTRVRRWDQKRNVDAKGLLTTAAGPMDLGDGVRVSFSTEPGEGRFKVGDYWVFAARTADGSVEELHAAPPRGIHHHYARLAFVTWSDGAQPTQVHDCRQHWPPVHCCPIMVRPGEDIQAAIDRVPAEGGCVCLLPGLHPLYAPLSIDGRENLTLKGHGPASKLVFIPTAIQNPHQGMLSITGGSEHIQVQDLLMHADVLRHLVVVDDAKEVSVANAVLVNGAEEKNDCLLLGDCQRVSVSGSTLVGHKGLVQADASLLERIRREPVVLDKETRTKSEPTAPEVETLQGLRLCDSRFYFVRAGIRLKDLLGGEIRDNQFRFLENAKLSIFKRPSQLGDRSTASFPESFYNQVDDWVLHLGHPGPPSPSPSGTGILAGLAEQLSIRDNHLLSARGISLLCTRQVEIRGNRLQVDKVGIEVAYGFELAITQNDITFLTPLTPPALQEIDPVEFLRHKQETGNLGISLSVLKEAAITDNHVTAPTAMALTTVWRSQLREAPMYTFSFLRLFRLQGLWRVAMELGWLVWQFLQFFWRVSPEKRPTKEEFTQTLFRQLLGLLGSGLVPLFAGQTVIARNHLEATHFGVFFDQVFTVGGLRLQENRVSGFHKTGILIHPYLSVGFPELFAQIVLCLGQWLVAFLTLLREKLREVLDGRAKAERPEAEAEWTYAGVMTQSVAWITYLCSRYCGQVTPPGEEGPTPGPSPIEDLEEALDDFLENLDATWLDDLVNQSYVIENNTLHGSGDGIWTGIDSSRVNDNQVTILPRNTIPFEAMGLGMFYQGTFEDSPFYNELLAMTLQGADREALLFFLLGNQNYLNEHLGNQNFRKALLQFVVFSKNMTTPESPMRAPLTDMTVGLNEDKLDLDKVREGWFKFLLAIWENLRGYGIALLGANMVCQGNRVRSASGCGLDRLGKVEFPAAMDPLPRDHRAAGDQPAARLLTGVRYTSLGGIWQFSNMVSLASDIYFLMVNQELKRWHRLLLHGEIALAHFLLMSNKNRSLNLTANVVHDSLCHGIRTLGDVNLTELDIFDNLVQDAGRYGICHIGMPNAKVNAKIHRNTVGRTQDNLLHLIFGQAWGQFAALIWVDNPQGTSLLFHNHGDGKLLSAQEAAIQVISKVVGIMGNHIITDAKLAFDAGAAGRGLFTDNLANQGSDIPAALRQGPDVTNL